MSNRSLDPPAADAPNDSGGEGEALRIQILGPLRVWRGTTELDVGPRQQAYLLAVLLAREGRPVSRSELIDLVWETEPPRTATNVIHKYVGALRRLLEPSLAPRAAGSHLLRRGNAYLFAAKPGALDLAMFRDLVDSAAVARAEHRDQAALDHYVEALDLWHGPAGDGLDHGPAAMPIFTGLNSEFLDACVAAAELALSLGRPERVVQPLQLAAAMAPLHEPVQASLIPVLAAAGQQAEALSVYRAVRTRLAEDLGIDPGELLETAHRRVLSRDLAPATGSLAVTPHAVTDAGGQPPAETSGDALIGRREELASLRSAIEPAFAGETGLAVVEGEPGVGKTRLLEELAAEAERRGARVVWGHCHDSDGTPSLWPWVQVVGTLINDRPTAAREQWLVGGLGELLDPSADALTASVLLGTDGQFEMFQRIVELVAQVASRAPLLLVLDDLQWADVASLHLFSHVVGQLPQGTAVVGALRDRAPVPASDLARALASASREPGHRRVRLGPLGLSDVAELVRRQTGREPDPVAVRSVRARTDGNPFFVRELARLAADGGPFTEVVAARVGVPSTVRDVVRDRIAGLDSEANDLLQIAALLGSGADIGLLALVAGLDVQACLDRLEPLESLGLLGPTPGDPFSFRFVHDIVRESVSEAIPQRQASLLHLRIADGLETLEGEPAPERLAHHLWAAGPLADPTRTTRALVRAGRRAARKTALEAAAEQFHAAVGVARRAGLAEMELASLSELAAVAGMKAMYGSSALDLLERAEDIAKGLGRKVEATGFLFTRWAVHAQGIQLDRSGPLARRLLEEGEASGDPILRAYGLNAWGIHQWAIGNNGDAYRLLNEARGIMVGGLADRDQDPVGYDLRLLVIGMLAETTAIHGDVGAAWELLDAMDATADDAYTVAVASTFRARIAAIAGDPIEGLRAAERGISVDPHFSFVFLGTYQRLTRCWARAMTGADPAVAAEEAEQLIAKNLLNPPRSCVATWFGLLSEMRLAAGDIDEAKAALDQADACLDTYGQRYPEPLLVLFRARLLHAQGESLATVRATAERSLALASQREATLFARRAEAFLAELTQ